MNGVRINWIDNYLEEVNGINLTLWKPKDDEDVGGTVRGLAIGLLSPVALHFRPAPTCWLSGYHPCGSMFT